MAAMVRTLSFFLLVLLVSSLVLTQTEAARPFNILSSGTPASKMIGNFFDGLSLGAIKDSGPSPGTGGHKFTNSDTLGGIKNSGPSPGIGHSATTETHQ